MKVHFRFAAKERREHKELNISAFSVFYCGYFVNSSRQICRRWTPDQLFDFVAQLRRLLVIFVLDGLGQPDLQRLQLVGVFARRAHASGALPM